VTIRRPPPFAAAVEWVWAEVPESSNWGEQFSTITKGEIGLPLALKLAARMQRAVALLGYRPAPLVINATGGVNSEQGVALLQRWFQEAIDD
jgi:hypothetical protein